MKARDDVVTITLDEYESLQEDARMLRCLENAGVDNWQWYDEAMKEFIGGNDE